ncbi:hypothetical protein [Microbacterium deminutum]|uniref:Uncharacterized protein n=1 Tax=Microbacterium deminutum TaxID=344164 RepID=A0ABP5BUW0_9MICO
MGASGAGLALVIVAWVFAGLLLLLGLTCIAASRGALPLNHFFGVRLPPLMRSEDLRPSAG